MTVAEALRAAAGRLAATSDTARLDAEVLMAHALGVTRSRMLLHHGRDPAPPAFAGMVERRMAHEPVAYLTGRQEFYGLDLAVTRDTLIPRGDSETLIEAARMAFADRAEPRRILDMGTGSGALLLAALSIFPQAQGTAIDASEAALAVAQANADTLGLAARCTMLRRSWLEEGWADGLGRSDLVLCNPPYVETTADLDRSVAGYEPASALFAGADGLDDYRVILPQLAALLSPGGIAIVEIGASQAAAVSDLAHGLGHTVAVRQDLAGRDRALIVS